MAKADSIQNGIKTDTTDDVEKSLELLDKVLSEFEEEQEIINAPVEPDSPSQGHQSEDDGYMSMNGRRAKFVPDFQPTDEANAPSLPLPVPPDGKYSPPSPEEAERIISNLLPRISPTSSPTRRTNSTSSSSNNRSPAHNTNSSNNHHHNHSSHNDWRTRNIVRNSDSISSSTSEKPSSNDNTVIAKSPTQTTLPKTRPSNVLPTRYASLPCSSPPKYTELSEPSGGSLDDGRNKLGGIGISAVHDAVLRGMTRMPEPIVNEHPVTIYPGRVSPPRRNTSRNLPGSIERHRDVCRSGNYGSDNSSSQENSSPENNESENNSSLSPTHGVQININYNNNLVNNRIFANSMEYTRSGRQRTQDDSDEERFSEDSLEESSLPPPPGPPTVPPPPSLSAPVTPSKRHSIAWEVNLDDPASFGDPLAVPKIAGSGCTKVIGRRKGGKNVNSSQSSLESTPSNKKSESNEWPDPPDIPICSTEDEAASLYSDSDELIPHIPDTTGRGTYVIRKGRRRQRLESLDSNASNNLPIPGSEPPPITTLPSPVYPASMMTPKSRHSIDLGLSSSLSGSAKLSQKLPASVLSPRSRLSLDLSSPTSELSTSVKKISTPTGSFPTPMQQPHQQQHLPSQSHSNNNNSLNKTKSNQVTTNNNTSTACVNNSNVSIGNGGSVGPVLVGSGSSVQSGSLSQTQQQQHQQQQPPIVSSRYTEFKTYSSTFDGLQALEGSTNVTRGTTVGNGSAVVSASDNDNSLMRVSSLPAMAAPHPGSATAENLSTPRRELAPPIEEDEEVDSDTQRGAPLRKIEDNISALLRGDISVARVADIPPMRRPLGFRLGVHKSESAKEMLLSQAGLGPLPPSPPSSSPEPVNDSDEFPPLPPSPTEEPEVIHQMHGIRISSRSRSGSSKHDAHYREEHPPAVPPHRGPSINTLKTRSMDAGFSKSYRNGSHASTSPHAPGTLPPDLPGCNSRRRIITGGYQKRTAQSPREERSLQTSCSLPETPIFARGCDIPRTPHRRAPEVPPHGSGSRTAPRTNTNTTSSLGSSVVGIGTSTIGGRQRSISHAFANGEMLRLAGGPARGWYPKQRHPRPASTEHLDRLHPQGSLRAWEAGTGSRKPLTLPPNLTPKFFNKSPREALRRVTSLLIRKGNSGTKEKESRKEKDRGDKEAYSSSSIFLQHSPGSDVTDSRSYLQHQQQAQQHHHSSHHTTPTTQKKKGFFKSFWKKSRHYSLEKQ